MIRIRFLMDRDYRFRDEIYIDDVDPVMRTEGKYRQAGEEDERANHIELCCLRVTTIPEDDARTKDRMTDIGQQFVDHMLTELFGARVWVEIRTVPVQGIFFFNYFIEAISSDGDRAHIAEPANPVVVARRLCQFDHFQGSAQVDIETCFFTLAVERSRAMDHRVGRSGQLLIC